jgi:hypothetical protein
MTIFLSRFMNEADAERLITAFYFVLTGCVFAFLTLVTLLR